MGATKDILLGKIRGGEPMTMRQQIKLVSLLSYPAILAQFSSVIMQYIDTAMVGHLGAAAGASIGLVSTCLWLFGGFGMALCSGFSVQVAQYIGARMNSSARNVLRQGIFSCLIFSGALAIIGVLVSGHLPYWLGGTEEIAANASKYFLINALFLPMMQLDWMSATMLQCSGNMKIPSILSILMCVLDVIFNYIFIYLLGMGVPGAALGTGLAEAVTALLMFYFLAVRSPELKLTSEKGSFVPKGATIIVDAM
ncbi:MAG: polysaccharide biosynthesis C-terminal domain-containing protein [Bacteroidales bacterium]|nr:polysaccharide biosynthesis C-terminal domain-containing protein [Bacteroidales bacterium]